MAAPVFHGSTSGYTPTGSESTSHVVTLPSSVASGDLLVLFLAVADADNVISLSGWTLADTTLIHFITPPIPEGVYAAYWKVAGSSESNPTVSLTISDELAYVCHRYSNAALGPVADNFTFDWSVSPDPVEVTSPTTSDDFYQVAVAFWIADTYPTAYPTSFTDNQISATSSGSDPNKVGVAVAIQLVSVTEYPDVFTLDSVADWGAINYTVISAPPPIPSGSGTVEGVGELDGDGYSEHSGSGDVIGEGVVTGDGDTTASGSGDIAGVGELDGDGYAQHSGSGDIVGVGELTGDGSSGAVGGSGSIVGVGELDGEGYAAHSGSGDIEGDGTPEGEGYTAHSGSGDIEGVGTLSGEGDAPPDPPGEAEGYGSVVGVGSLSGEGYAAHGGSGTLYGVGTLIGAAPVTPTSSGAKHMKCCCGPIVCRIGEDDFNRADSDDPGTQWSEESGDWDISGNTLVGVSAGVLATTLCHPAYAPLGSFVAQFDLVSPTGGSVYRIRAGNPASSTNEASWTFAGTAGSGTITIEVTNGTDTETLVAAWVEEGGPAVRVCYWPGTMLTASIPSNQAQSGSASVAAVCLGTGGTGRCHTGLGNFSFLEGSFDNWTYDIHWMEQRTCPECGCTCREVIEGEETFFCVDSVLCATITNVSGCDGISQSQDMHLLAVDGFNDDSAPTTYVDPSRSFWISDPFICPQETEPVGFVIILECHIDPSVGYPRFIAYLRRYLPTGQNCSGIGFVSDPDTIVEACSESGIDICYSSHAYSTSGSTCDPFYLQFPDIWESFWSCPSLTAGCCGGGVISDDPETEEDESFLSPSAYMTLEITAGSCA